jgi:hypothetical protein
MLRSGLDTGILVAADGLLHGDTGQVGVGSETLPVAARIGRASEGTSDRTEDNMGSLGLELLAHGIPTLVQDISIPGRCDGDTSREDRGIVGYTDGQGTVLQTETAEIEARDSHDVSDTGTGLAGDHVSLFIEGQLGDKILSL